MAPPNQIKKPEQRNKEKMNTPGWTQENLLDEALALIDTIDQEKDPKKLETLDGCFLAVQEVMIAKREKETDEIPSVRH